MPYSKQNQPGRCSSGAPTRRGNAMILVAGVLVLLVILATTFISRAQAGRDTSAAVRVAQTNTLRADALGRLLADEVTRALFVAPIDISQSVGDAARNGNAPRLTPELNADFANALPLGPYTAGRYGVDPNFTFNFAPSHLIPWTNWPDEVAGTLAGRLPVGPGAPAGNAALDAGNPLGGPGHGDARWLRDSEPLRGGPNVGSLESDFFRFWRHMTYLARPDNGLRLVRDISNVVDPVNGVPNIVTNLNIPHEQWLVNRPPDPLTNYNQITGQPLLSNNFLATWDLWLTNDLNIYAGNFSGGTRTPLNFLQLNDLDGDNNWLEIGERPQDEFVAGSSRHAVSRILTDTDGDGFTDAFWFLVPGVNNGVRQIVAASITDNGARLNANTGLAFDPVNTRGTTGSDLALVGQNLRLDYTPGGGGGPGIGAPNWNVGFFDATHNQGAITASLYGGVYGANSSDVRWDAATASTPGQWPDYLFELGITDPLQIDTDFERRFYWRSAGNRPQDPLFGYRPFSTADDLELRLRHGNATPWTYSRFERAVNDQDTAYGFLRADVGYTETTPLAGLLTNVGVVNDVRRHLTMFNGSRNDLMPAWLWWRWFGPGPTGPQMLAPPEAFGAQPTVPLSFQEMQLFMAQAQQKLDLREANPELFDQSRPFLYFHERLPYAMLNLLADGDDTAGSSYLGDYTAGDTNKVDDLRRLASMFSANVLSYADQDSLAPLFDDFGAGGTGQVGATPLAAWADATDTNIDPLTRFLGMEAQPFLVEAFVGHVYKAYEIPPGYTNSGDKVLLASEPNGVPLPGGDPGSGQSNAKLNSTVVAVQIANPYLRYDADGNEFGLFLDDPTLDYHYEIEVFGERISFPEIARVIGRNELRAARADLQQTLVLYMAEESIDGDGLRNRIADFLDLEKDDHDEWNSIIVDITQFTNNPHPATGQTFTSGLSTDREDYEDTDSDGIQIVRVYDPIVPLPETRVVIDRIDAPDLPNSDDGSFKGRLAEFGRAQFTPRRGSELGDIPAPAADPANPTEMHPTFPAWEPTAQDRDHWMQWASVQRAWGHDFNGPNDDNEVIYDANERNPRYIDARNKVRTSEQGNPFDPRYGGGASLYQNRRFRGGISFNLTTEPDTGETVTISTTDSSGNPITQDVLLPWMTIIHSVPWSSDRELRKPTFFDGRRNRTWLTDPDLAVDGFPPVPVKGFYPSSQRYATQMLQKDNDFEQVGELLNIWTYCHELEFEITVPGSPPATPPQYGYVKTEKTFSEFLADGEDDYGDLENVFHGRLRAGELMGVGDPLDYTDPRHAMPDAAAGLAILDAFVCDGPGRNYRLNDPNWPGVLEDYRFDNARGFTGKATAGLINVNTAPVEVMRTLPHWYKLVHPTVLLTDGQDLATLPRTSIPEALMSYRDRMAGGLVTYLDVPDYSDRRDDEPQTRGLETLGQLRFLNRVPASTPTAPNPNFDSVDYRRKQASWSINFAATEPFDGTDGGWLSTDVTPLGPNAAIANVGDFDGVSRDVEEQNLLLAGASNMISTGSDVFTITFRVRSFKQDPVTGLWDALNRENIVDDARYVMVVDRSGVERPSDAPRILYMSKVQE